MSIARCKWTRLLFLWPKCVTEMQHWSMVAVTVVKRKQVQTKDETTGRRSPWISEATADQPWPVVEWHDMAPRGNGPATTSETAGGSWHAPCSRQNWKLLEISLPAQPDGAPPQMPGGMDPSCARHMTRFRASCITGYRDRRRSQVLLSRNLQGEERASKRGRRR
jgi:hypothetical protein